MRHWEDVESLTSVLDRHADAIRSYGTSDWSMYWALAVYIEFLNSEPLLRDLLSDFIESARQQDEVAREVAQEVFSRATKIVEECPELGPLPGRAPCTWRELNTLLADLRSKSEEGESGRKSDVGVALRRLFVETKAAGVNLQWTEETLPGYLYLHLARESMRLQVPDLDDTEMLSRHAESAETFVKRISDSTIVPNIRPIPQPSLVQISRSIDNLNLAIITALSRGASRKALVRRFAARCASLDRERIVAELGRQQKAEAWLTLEFARYLFDAGYNPLVDAEACGLRPDVFDPSRGSALYVEAKQYEDVGVGIRTKLKIAIAQTLNTWARLASRWRVPEAFLLIFRRSGAHLEFDSKDLRTAQGWLRLEIVDLASSDESGSRAKKVVTIRSADLLPDRGTEQESDGGTP